MIGQFRASYNGVRTRVLSVPGGGTPLVLLHGYAGSADTWRAVLTGLEQAGRRALAVDLPGFGRADPRVSGPMLPQFDGFVDAILDQDGPAVLVGNSLGAATAVRAASRNSEAVKGVVALDDPLNAQHWLARLARRREIPEVFWSWAGRVRIPPSVLRWATRRAVANVVYGPGAVADPDVVAYWSRLFSQTSDAALLGRYMFQYAYETAAGHQDVDVTCPTLIVHGGCDRIIPVHSSRHLHHQIPGSDFVVLPRSGHCPHLDNPGEVVRLTLSLLNRIGDDIEKAIERPPSVSRPPR